jgi:lipoprotein-releasing system permease protein
MSLFKGQPFEWIVAMRFLSEGKVQTSFIIGGISIGVAVIIFMSALLSGLQSNFVKRVLTGQAHIQILPPKEVVRALQDFEHNTLEGATMQAPLQRIKSIDQWQSVAHDVMNFDEVVSVSPAATGAALVTRGNATQAVSITGMVPEIYYNIIPLPEKIVQGNAFVTHEDIVIGTELADNMGLTIGDKIRLSAANGTNITLTVRGIFDLGNKGANTRNAYVSLRTAQSILGMIGAASVLDVTVKDVYEAEIVARKIAQLTHLDVESWIKTNEQFFIAVGAQTTANSAIRFFVALSVGFGIASVLVVSVVQRSSNIGILRAMGVTRGQILRVFLLQGGVLGFAGAWVGALMGGMALMAWEHFEKNPDGSVMFTLNFEPRMFVMAIVLATLTGLLAAVAPALRAARLDPVVAIRG